MKNQLKRSRVLNGVLAGALALVVVGSTAVVGAVSNGFQDWGRLSAPVQVQTNGAEEVKSGFEVSNVQENGIRLMSATIDETNYEDYGISPLAESAVTLTATITPSDATYKQVDWIVRWKNASSTWASGKTVTDYVTVATATDGAGTATMSCLKAFSEQIEVVATARDNTTRTATCTVDYAMRVTNVESVCVGHDEYDEKSILDSSSYVEVEDAIWNEEVFGGNEYVTAVYDISDYTIGNWASPEDQAINFYFMPSQDLYETKPMEIREFDHTDYGYNLTVFGNYLLNCFDYEVDSNGIPTFNDYERDTIEHWVAGHEVGDEAGTIYVEFVLHNSTYVYEIPVYLGRSFVVTDVSSVSLDTASVVF